MTLASMQQVKANNGRQSRQKKHSNTRGQKRYCGTDLDGLTVMAAETTLADSTAGWVL